MTDAEIIKALECHTGVYKGAGCMHCGFTTYGCDCLKQLNEASLDLINRQKAEYEDLYKKYCELAKITNERIPVLTKEVQKSKEELEAEAIKEFAERLKERSRYPNGTIYVEHIDNLVKEMEGDTE